MCNAGINIILLRQTLLLEGITTKLADIIDQLETLLII